MEIPCYIIGISEYSFLMEVLAWKYFDQMCKRESHIFWLLLYQMYNLQSAILTRVETPLNHGYGNEFSHKEAAPLLETLKNTNFGSWQNQLGWIPLEIHFPPLLVAPLLRNPKKMGPRLNFLH